MGLKKLLVDVPALIESGVKADLIECEYLFHRNNKGTFSLLEVAQFAAYCRQCTDSFCIDACPKEALERQENGTIKRLNMRCVGCKSCILACPFGTIFPEVINYVSSKCDFCLNQLKDNPDYIPACAKTAPENTIIMKEIEEELPDEYIYFYGDHLAIKNPSWLRKEARA
jgi:Fe-S-cluster-containing dehydrogenase component